jgi:flagellar assembly protein FliH
MSMSTEPRPGGPVLRGVHTQDVLPARFNVDLRRVPDQSAHDDVAKTRAAGYAQGWSQGRMAAELAVQTAREQTVTAERAAVIARVSALQAAATAVAGAAERLERRLAPQIAELEDLILDAAVQIAQALLARELRTAPAGADPVRRAMSLAPADGPAIVRLNPADFQALTGSDLPSYEYEHEGRLVRLRPDPALAPGDAIAECGSTTVDARLALAVARVREAIEAGSGHE